MNLAVHSPYVSELVKNKDNPKDLKKTSFVQVANCRKHEKKIMKED